MIDLLTILLLVFVIAASALDIWFDLSHGASISHVLQEAIVLFFATGLLFALIRALRAQKRELAQLRVELESARQPEMERSPVVNEAAMGLREAVETQFREWNLTTSEREVGWLLLKGLSVKEIAAVRSTQEKTARQQASAIYQKAELPGRHAFAAWFIEDLI